MSRLNAWTCCRSPAITKVTSSVEGLIGARVDVLTAILFDDGHDGGTRGLAHLELPNRLPNGMRRQIRFCTIQSLILPA